MELFAAPPAELAAIADPSARGAAPLLRSPGVGSRAPPDAVPFELLIGLLTEPQPAGESWPASGKQWPLPRLQVLPESLAAMAALAASAGAMPPIAGAPGSPLLEAAQPARSGLPASSAADPSALALPAPRLLVLSPSEGPALAAAGAQPGVLPLASPDGLAPAEVEAVRIDTAASSAAEAFPAVGAEPDAPETPLSSDARLRAQLGATAPAEPRPGAASVAPPAAAPHAPPAPEAYAPPVREKPAQQAGLVRRPDSLRVLAPLAAGSEAPAGVAGDWLPAAHGHGATGAAGTAAAPAASALPNAPVDARLPDWHEAFAQRVQWLVDTEAGEARIKLNPPELGAVDVKISLVDDKTHVHLTASTAAARDELAQGLPRLRELFTVSGLDLGSASVHDGRGGDHARPGGDHACHADGTPRDAAVAALAGLLDEPAAAARTPTRGRIDVFA